VSSKNQATYSIETDLPLQNSYFRIAALSQKGSIHYSSIVKLGASDENNLKLIQNPVVNRIVKLDPGHLQTNAAYTIINTNGKLVKKGMLNPSDASINLSSLPAGLYFLQIQRVNEVAKFVLQ
jgi:hypothetical protein